ncbi:MAG: hypothetical protein B5766_07785 [Candidatus Lumbricidophila eiseniae]|uniref:Uncharacterized protein n=1 Tax=Candidatus Lumbricidiphila eiseniae TaxID=1969409 RepID=A0A2A6FR07_9MICO|nr:MAG: hypothetical protein B5766_07785 [Candidatus Lumbricidophila eiseniae]
MTRMSVAGALSIVRSWVAGISGRSGFVIAIDGPSGAGKSTFADLLVDRWTGYPITLLRLDDAYPGWHGLDAGVLEINRRAIRPRLRGMTGHWRRWDWREDRAGAQQMVRPGGALIVEGCGAFAAVAGVASAAQLRVWVEAGPADRQRRALARDGGAFDPYWDTWQQQWQRYLARTRASKRADLTVIVCGQQQSSGPVAARPDQTDFIRSPAES